MNRLKFFISCLVLVLFIFTLHFEVYARNEKIAKPKELGMYIKTKSGLKRLIPNIVFDEGGILFIESNNPQKFALKDIQHIVVYGQYDMDILTLNPLLFFQVSALNKPRYLFGKDIEIIVKKQKSEDLYIIKPKGLFGRGYFCLWINDSAWDFIIE